MHQTKSKPPMPNMSTSSALKTTKMLINPDIMKSKEKEQKNKVEESGLISKMSNS